jgi:hypothetical protein
MPSKHALDQIRVLIAKGLSLEQIALVMSVGLGANVTAKQVKELVDSAPKTEKP